jgi:hypothetical protein
LRRPTTARCALVGALLAASCQARVVPDHPIGAVGGECESDGSCDSGLVCIDHRCVDPLANLCAGVGCSGHGSCTLDGKVPRCDCASGYHSKGTTCLADVAARLTWSPPRERADGTPLGTLAGYWVHYDTRPRATPGFSGYSLADDIGTPSCEPDDHGVTTCTYILESLPTGTWYFAVTSYDVLGNVSDLSNEVTREVP